MELIFTKFDMNCSWKIYEENKRKFYNEYTKNWISSSFTKVEYKDAYKEILIYD